MNLPSPGIELESPSLKADSLPAELPGNTGMGCHLLLQDILLNQGMNPGFLHWQEDYLLSEPPGKSIRKEDRFSVNLFRETNGSTKDKSQ